MAQNRHLSRTICMQALYEWEFRSEMGDFDLDEVCRRNIAEFAKDVDQTYVKKVVFGVHQHWDEINQSIEEAAPEWPLAQVARVDRNIIRVAVYEMLFDEEDDVPPRVSINEAIEIGKTFGGENAPKFINGVLGAIYRKNDQKLIPRDQK